MQPDLGDRSTRTADSPGAGGSARKPDDEAASRLVSVLVPCWNARSTISRALESVLIGQEIDLECVVVDDGSTDGTVEVVREIAANDRRVVLLERSTNEGVSAARNHGLRAATGHWLTFLDADDRFLPGGLAALVRPTTKTDALAVIGQRVWSDGQSNWVSSFYDIPDIRTPGRKSLVRNPGLVYYASATGKLIHRSCTHGLLFYGRVLGDQPWTIRALLRAGDRLEVIDDVVYEWTRPVRGQFLPTITALTRSSAGLGVESAAVAERALSDVRAEAEDRIVDPGDRRVVTSRYVERLLRSDLGVHLSRAIQRHDPDIAELIAAIDRFVAGTPPELLAASDALGRNILTPPLRGWSWLSKDARAAWRSLFEAALQADPYVTDRLRGRSARLAVRIARGDPGWPGSAAIWSLVRFNRLLAAVRRRLRR